MSFITVDDVKPYLQNVDISDEALGAIVADAEAFIIGVLRERMKIYDRPYTYTSYDYLGSGTVSGDDLSMDDVTVISTTAEGEIVEITHPDAEGAYSLHFYSNEYYYVWVLALGYEPWRLAVYNTGDLGAITLRKSEIVKNAIRNYAAGKAIEAAGFKSITKVGVAQINPPDTAGYYDAAEQSLHDYLKKASFYMRSV